MKMMKELTFLTCFIITVSTRNVHHKIITAWNKEDFLLDHGGSGGSYHNSDEVCRTEKCIAAAEIILKGMNKSANPCKDFYEYACGGWSINFPVPVKESEWNIDGIVQQDINEMKRRNINA